MLSHTFHASKRLPRLLTRSPRPSLSLSLLRRAYTEAPEICDAIQAGYFAPQVPPSYTPHCSVCVDLYREKMQPSYVLALPEACEHRLQWLQAWMQRHEGHSPYEGLYLERETPAPLFRLLPAQHTNKRARPRTDTHAVRPVRSALDWMKDKERDAHQHLALHDEPLDEYEWYDAMEYEALRASAPIDPQGRTITAAPTFIAAPTTTTAGAAVNIAPTFDASVPEMDVSAFRTAQATASFPPEV